MMAFQHVVNIHQKRSSSGSVFSLFLLSWLGIAILGLTQPVAASQGADQPSGEPDGRILRFRRSSEPQSPYAVAEHGIPINDTEHHGGDDHDDGHHGVRLASWRWDEYSNILTFLIMVILAGVLKLLFHHVPFLSQHFPESCVLIVIGVVFGVIIYYGFDNHTHHFPEFTSSLFFNVLLPPIILDSAYALYDRDFLANLGTVILFAVVGTLFNVFVIGGCLYLFYSIGWMGDTFPAVLDPINCLVFSSLISAVDPVAVLAIFEEIGVNMGLYFLVFGESLLNDGVTVVLYNTMVALSGQEDIDYTQYILAFFSFFTVVFGGLIIGCIIGCLSALIVKHTQHTRVIEPLIILATSYLAFILAECIHWSGIISLIGCGIMQKRYAFPNISKKSYTTVKYSIKTFAAFSDCIIFLFLGIVTIEHSLEWHTGFVLWTVLLCTVVRFVGVFSLSWFINKRRVKDISFKEQFIMAYGGLRGAVGFSLVTILDESNPFKDIFLTTTLVMIFFTVFIQGGTIKLLVSKLKITRKTEGDKGISTEVNMKTIDHVMAGIESVTGKHSRYYVMELIRTFDKNYTKKWLIRKDAEDLLTLKFQKITLDEHYARLYGPAVLVHNRKSDNPQFEGIQGITKPLHPTSEAFSQAERKKLRLALRNTPFEQYQRKAFQRDSPEHIANLIRHDREERNRLLNDNLLRPRSMAAASPMTNFEGEDGSEGRMLWKRGLSAAGIRQTYQEVKDQYKPIEGQETTL